MATRCREWNDEDTVTLQEGVEVELEGWSVETGMPTGSCPLHVGITDCLPEYCRLESYGEYLQTFEIAKIQWLYSVYSSDEFLQTLFSRKHFSSRFPGNFASIFQRKIIPI